MHVPETLLIPVVAVAAAIAGCGDVTGLGDPSLYERPTVAVLEFENRAPFPLSWDLGGGMSDMLVDRLLATGRFTVIEHQELRGVMAELQVQQSGATRPQRRAKLGRFKNIQYFVKGTITDFGHVSGGSSALGIGDARLFGGGSKAVFGLTVYVIEVESREIVCSRRIEKAVHAQNQAVKLIYSEVSFGGRSFYETPLGEATAEVMGQAVRTIARGIAADLWQPRIATVQGPERIAINGGRNRRLRRGAAFDVQARGEAILDPQTGDEVGRTPGKVLGRIEVTEVHDRWALAKLIAGNARKVQPGLLCVPGDR